MSNPFLNYSQFFALMLYYCGNEFPRLITSCVFSYFTNIQFAALPFYLMSPYSFTLRNENRIDPIYQAIDYFVYLYQLSCLNPFTLFS